MTQVNKQEIQKFIKSWSQGAHEVADKVTFWNTILRFLGVPQEKIDNRSFIDYEKTIKLKKNEHFDGSMDGYIPSTHVIIEQKSSGVDLTKKENRPNGGNTEKITPFEQARRYDSHLSAKEHAYFYVLCNFDEFIIYGFLTFDVEIVEILTFINYPIYGVITFRRLFLGLFSGHLYWLS